MDIIGLCGGLALFLYGMSVLGDGLREVSGGRMEKLLEKLTSNRYKACLLGLLVTAVIQSSGATVVMVVGLVNSGIMSLQQSVGVILGANIGTTVTAWILSTTGISGDNIAVQLLKPSNFAPILALIGVVLTMMKKESRRRVGTILVGFSVLMIGMSMMSDAFGPLSSNPRFTGILTMFSDQPLLGLLAGFIVTAIIQSSSASIGILQAMSLGGTMRIGSAIPVLMGENIGSAVTGLISAIGSSRNAKRAAWIQMWYGIIKTTTFMVVFYTLNAFLHFPFMERIATPVNIAVIHSLFNIVAVIVFLPISDLFIRIVEKMFPELPEEREAKALAPKLDERFLTSPSFALAQARTAVNEMADLSMEALKTAMSLLFDFNEEAARKVDRIERSVDAYEDQLDTYLVKVGRRTMSAKDSREDNILLHCINDFERITDHALNIMQAATELNEKGLTFSPRAQEEMRVYGSAVQRILSMAIEAFKTNDMAVANEIEPLEEVIDGLNMEEKRRHIRRLRKGKCTVEAGFILSDIQVDYERIADHCSNIAVALQQTNNDSFDTHEFLEEEKSERTPTFDANVARFEKEFALPVMKKDEEIRLENLAGVISGKGKPADGEAENFVVPVEAAADAKGKKGKKAKKKS